MDTTKLGLASAKAMDRLEKLLSEDFIADDAEIGAVVILVALDSKTPDDAPDREKLRDVATQTFIFSEPEHIYIEQGLIEIARHQYGSATEDED